MDPYANIMTRRSVRNFAPGNVEAAEVESLLRAAMAAPSAGNQQSWRFVIVRDPGEKMRLATTSPYATPLLKAPVGVVVLGDTTAEKFPGNWVLDCSAAVQNFLLAAHARGFGGVWLGVWPDEDRVRGVAQVIEPPEGVVPFAMIALGRPERVPEPAERYHAEFVHFERWGS